MEGVTQEREGEIFTGEVLRVQGVDDKYLIVLSAAEVWPTSIIQISCSVVFNLSLQT